MFFISPNSLLITVKLIKVKKQLYKVQKMVYRVYGIYSFFFLLPM